MKEMLENLQHSVIAGDQLDITLKFCKSLQQNAGNLATMYYRIPLVDIQAINNGTDYVDLNCGIDYVKKCIK